LLKLAGKDLENVASQIEECGGLDKIESLQNHENVDIYKLAYEIVEKFFNDEPEEIGNLEPQIGDGSFQFNPDGSVGQAGQAAAGVPAPEGGFQADNATGGAGGFQF